MPQAPVASGASAVAAAVGGSSGAGGSSSSSAAPGAIPAGLFAASASGATFEATYEKGLILGRGASGVAFIVRPKCDSSLELVAKEICLMRSDEKRRKEALAESRMLREMFHQNIVTCFDVFEELDMLYIVMEYANGGDLGRRIQVLKSESRRLAECTVMTVFAQLSSALFYIHSQKIMHRDIKPANIFIVGEGDLSTCVIKLGDFGIAKVIEGTMGQANSTVGTPSYLSPEICKNNPYGMKADVWSLGVVLYELTCLKVPFHAGNLPAMALMICTADPKPLPEEYSREMNDLMFSLLQKDPAKRIAMSTIMQQPYVQGFPVQPTRNCSSPADDLTGRSSGSSGEMPAGARDSNAGYAEAVQAPLVAPPAAQSSRGTSQSSRASRGAEAAGSRLPSCNPPRSRLERQTPDDVVPASTASSRLTPRSGAAYAPQANGALSTASGSGHRHGRAERAGERSERGDRAERWDRSGGPYDHRLPDRVEQQERVDKGPVEPRADRTGNRRPERLGYDGNNTLNLSLASSTATPASIDGRRDHRGVGRADRTDRRSRPERADERSESLELEHWADQQQRVTPKGAWHGDLTMESFVGATPDQSTFGDADEDFPFATTSSGGQGSTLAPAPASIQPPSENWQEPSPPGAEPPTSSSVLTALWAGAIDPGVRLRPHARRRRGRPPLLVGQDAVDGADVRSPARQPAPRRVEEAVGSPGEAVNFHSTAPLQSTGSSSLAHLGARSVSPTRSGAGGESGSLPVPSMMRSSGSAPSLPPLPPLMAPPRGTVRSRSVAGLHDAGRATMAEGFQPLQRGTVSHNMFRTAPLPVSRETELAGEGRDSRNLMATLPVSLAPPPQQPPPSQRQAIARDESSIARLVPKLPTALGGQTESRSLLSRAAVAAASSVRDRSGISEPSGAAPVSVAVTTAAVREGWGTETRDPEARLATARLSVV